MNDDRNSRRVLPIGLVAIAAVIFSLVPGGGTPGPAFLRAPSPPAGRESAAAAAAAAENAPLKPLYDYLDMLSGGTAKPPRKRDPKKDCPPEDLHPVRFLIATVPDPIDSHLAQSFDRALDAIQNGMQDNNFVLDRFYLPWKRDGETRLNVSRLQPGTPESFLSLVAKSMTSDTHRNQPGVLLFRGETPKKKDDVAEKVGEDLVIIFLVGETPTRGIQREAMTKALDAIEAWPGRKHPCAKLSGGSEIRILGPYFSGSADSLHHLLWAWNEDPKTKRKEITIVSGSATADSNLEELRLQTYETRKDSAETKDPLVSFQATVVPDGALTRVFNRFLRNQLRVCPANEVALFVEGGTRYGVGFKERGKSDKSKESRVLPQSLEWRASPCATHTGSAAQHGNFDRFRFVLSFPLHVSQLRGAYEKEDALRNQAPAGGAPRRALELPLEAPEGQDILPAQDPRMTANIADLVLASGVETIRRENIRFVGIVASDPRDVLFVARKIREAGANVTLFTFGADILYTHPDYERYLRGMLVITPYPLFPSNQAWTGSDQVRLAFAGATEEGIYNAVLYLLWNGDKARPPSLLEYRAPFPSARRPPIWIMAVGRHGFWPVDIIANYRTRYVLPGPALPQGVTNPITYRPPGGVLTLVLLEAYFLGAIVLYIILRRRAAPAEGEDRSRRTSSALLHGLVRRAEAILSVWSTPVAREINRTYLAALLLMFVFVQGTLLVYVSRASDYLPGAAGFEVCAIVVLVCLLALEAREVQRFVSALKSAEPGARGAWRYGVIPAIFLVAVAVVLTRYWHEIWTMDPEKAIAFYARVFDLTSTISPLLPLLSAFLVLALWALSNVQRAFLLEIESGASATARWPLMTLAGLPELETAIQKLLTDPGTRALGLLGPILAFVPFYSLMFEPFNTMDGPKLNLLLKFLLISCYFVIVYSFTLFIALWIRVRRLLKRLSWYPIAEAFKRLPESVAASPWRMWNAVPSFTGLQASVSLLRALANLGRGPLGEDDGKTLRNLADDAERLLQKALNESNRSFAASVPTQRELRQLLTDATALLLQPLSKVWHEWPGPAEAQDKLREAGEQEQFLGVLDWRRRDLPVPKTLWERAAEELVALRLSSYTHYVFLHMRNLLTFVFLGFLLVIAAINSYPFEPKHPVVALIWVVGLACIGLVAWAFLGMNRDRILCYIGKTKPGEVTMSFEFLTSMTIYVVVPLLTLLATQFPGLGDVVFSVFTPAMKSMR